jgi:hypothetical protein
MPMREDCLHYESRTYADDGEVARFCTLGLAPEAPWRCPEHCPRYERITLLTGDMEAGSLGHIPPVEEEPEGSPEAIADVLADAEGIVEAVEAEALAEADAATKPRRRWWRRRRQGPAERDDSHFGNR